MSTLIERLQEVMTTMKWEHQDLVRASGQSSSVVSQWLGHGSKLIKSIGSMEAATALESASGYASLWIAKGKGPKRRTVTPPLTAQSHIGGYSTPATVLRLFRELLQQIDPHLRGAFADVLAG